MLIKILIAVAVIIIVLVIFVAMQSSQFRVTRETSISAPPEIVFAQVNDFHNWRAWSPWEKIDPELKRTYSGAPAGTGAIYSWSGNKKAGQGRMTLTESRPGKSISIKLDFEKPFKATNMAEFTFKPDRNITVVTWSMFGDKNFMFKAVHLLMNIDKMVGGDFEKGLAQLKAVAEAASTN